MFLAVSGVIRFGSMRWGLIRMYVCVFLVINLILVIVSRWKMRDV